MEDFKRPYTDAELVALARRVHATARDKGWWPNTVDGAVVLKDGELEEKLVLVASELSEAFEEYRHPDRDVKLVYAVGSAGWLPWNERHSTMEAMPKPEGFVVEMADAYIRALDLVVAIVGKNLNEDVLSQNFRLGPNKTNVGKSFYWLFGLVSRATGHLSLYLPSLLLGIETICHDLGADLRGAIELKAKYNDTRSFRHGGKRA